MGGECCIIFLLPLGSRVPTNGFQMKGCSLLMQKSDQGRQDMAAKQGVVKQSISEYSGSSACITSGQGGKFIKLYSLYMVMYLFRTKEEPYTVQ